MQIYSYLVLICFFQIISYNVIAEIHEDDLCVALKNADKQKTEIISNQFLSSLSNSHTRNENFEAIKNWLQSHSCVDSVAVSDKIIETEPPLIEFAVYDMNPKSDPLAFWVSFDEKYQFYDLKRKINIQK